MLGYNPLIPDKELEDIDNKFNDDIELKELKEKALKFEWEILTAIIGFSEFYG